MTLAWRVMTWVTVVEATVLDTGMESNDVDDCVRQLVWMTDRESNGVDDCIRIRR